MTTDVADKTFELPPEFRQSDNPQGILTMPDGINWWTTRFDGPKPRPIGITGGGYCYMRDVNGFIMCGPSHNADKQVHVAQGRTILPKYGEHNNWLGDIPVVTQRSFDMLLRQGGGSDMPAEQVISLGFAAKPPVVDGKPVWKDSPVEAFPQLEGHEWMPLERCPYCQTELWSQRQKDAHLTVMHNDKLNAVETADATAKGIERAIHAVNDLNRAQAAPIPTTTNTPEAATEVVTQSTQPHAEGKFLCGRCEYGTGDIRHFLKHVGKNGPHGGVNT